MRNYLDIKGQNRIGPHHNDVNQGLVFEKNNGSFHNQNWNRFVEVEKYGEHELCLVSTYLHV